MKNAVIYVFSGTGNTLKIARAYADEFFSRGVSCKIHILEKDGILRFPPPQDFDLAGLAYPIHAFNAPYVVHRFAAALPDLPYKEYFIIKSSGEPLAINNISSGSLVAKLEKKGLFPDQRISLRHALQHDFPTPRRHGGKDVGLRQTAVRGRRKGNP